MGETFATSPIAAKPMQGNLAPQDAEVGEELAVDESSQQAAEVSFEHAPSFWESNIHNQARIEGANTPTDYFMFNQNGDGFAFTGRSTDPEVLQPSIQSNVEKMLTSARADCIENILVENYNGETFEVPGMTLRTIRMNQDKYPNFLVLGMPKTVRVKDEETGEIKFEQKFSLHVTYKPTGEVVKGDNMIKFITNIVQTALMAQEEDGIAEIAS